MAVATSVITFDVKDCKVYPLTADLSSGATTFGTAVEGDGGVVLAKKGKIDRLNFSCTYSELSLDVLAVLLGQTVTGAGSSGTYTATMPIDDSSLPYFMVAFLLDDLQHSVDDEPATVVVTLQKCQLTGGSLVSGSTDSFSNPTFSAEAILPYGTPVQIGDIEIAETAATL